MGRPITADSELGGAQRAAGQGVLRYALAALAPFLWHSKNARLSVQPLPLDLRPACQVRHDDNGPLDKYVCRQGVAGRGGGTAACAH